MDYITTWSQRRQCCDLVYSKVSLVQQIIVLTRTRSMATSITTSGNAQENTFIYYYFNIFATQTISLCKLYYIHVPCVSISGSATHFKSYFHRRFKIVSKSLKTNDIKKNSKTLICLIHKLLSVCYRSPPLLKTFDFDCMTRGYDLLK